MPASVTIAYDGLPEMLRELRRVDPDLRKRIPDEIKGAAAPLLAAVRSSYPTELTTGWPSGRGGHGYKPSRLKYSPGRARQRTVLKFKGTRPRNAPPGAFPILRVVARDPGVSIATLAEHPKAGRDRLGRPYGVTRGRGLVRALDGRPARYVWPEVDRWAPRLEPAIGRIVDRAARRTTTKLARRR